MKNDLAKAMSFGCTGVSVFDLASAYDDVNPSSVSFAFFSSAAGSALVGRLVAGEGLLLRQSRANPQQKKGIIESDFQSGYLRRRRRGGRGLRAILAAAALSSAAACALLSRGSSYEFLLACALVKGASSAAVHSGENSKTALIDKVSPTKRERDSS